MVLHAESPPVVHAAQVEHLHEGAAGPHDGLVLFFLDKTPHSRHMGILHHVQLPDTKQTPLTTSLYCAKLPVKVSEPINKSGIQKRAHPKTVETAVVHNLTKLSFCLQ
jgi:hypothetical protein